MGTFKPSTRHATRLQVRFTEEEVEAFRSQAQELGIPLTAAVRVLAKAGLAGRPDGRLDQLEAVVVAALMAGEHAVHLLELLLPGGARRSSELAGAVRLSALDRLAAVQQDLKESSS